jgi:hypothetical protein
MKEVYELNIFRSFYFGRTFILQFVSLFVVISATKKRFWFHVSKISKLFFFILMQCKHKTRNQFLCFLFLIRFSPPRTVSKRCYVACHVSNYWPELDLIHATCLFSSGAGATLDICFIVLETAKEVMSTRHVACCTDWIKVFQHKVTRVAGILSIAPFKGAKQHIHTCVFNFCSENA